MKIILPFIILVLAFSSQLQAGRNEGACPCKLEAQGLKTQQLSGLAFSANDCQRKLYSQKFEEVWDNICHGEKVHLTDYKLSCGTRAVYGKANCVQKTKYHSYLLFNKDETLLTRDKAESLLPQINTLLGHYRPSEFNLRRNFSYLAIFLEETQNVSLQNSLYGGIYDASTQTRADLTVIDFVLQVENVLEKKGFSRLRTEFEQIVSNDPIANFPEIFEWLDYLTQNSRSFKAGMSQIVPLLFSHDGLAIPPDLNFLSWAKLKNPHINKKIEAYNKVLLGPNKSAIFKELKRSRLPNHNYPITPEALSSLDEKVLDDVIDRVNKAEHLKRVKKFKSNAASLRLIFSMNPDLGHTRLERAFDIDSGLRVGQEVVDLFNYIQVKLDKNFVSEQFPDQVGDQISFEEVGPEVVKENFDFWEEVVQEYSWSRHITRGNDQVLLVLRKWMQENQSMILEDLKAQSLDANVLSLVNNWKVNRRPKRLLTIELYPTLKELYQDRPWEGESILNSQGQKRFLGDTELDKTLLSIKQGLGSVLNIENWAPSIAGSGLAYISGNPYLSATASTFLRDFIMAKKYGHEVGDYLKENTPTNLLGSLVFASGFTPGRMSDAIFRGATNGVMQSALTGRDFKIGMIVGGVTGGALQALPPELSNWVVQGQNKDELNILTEVAERAFFRGLQGGVVAYLEDGDYLSGLKEGAIYGSAEAALKIAVFGVRYDANSFISDEEIAEYNKLHNFEDGHYQGEHLQRLTAPMSERYGRVININRDDLQRAQFRKGGLADLLRKEGTDATNFSSIFSSENNMSQEALAREETLLHEVMHTRQQQQGRMLHLLNRIGPNSVPEGFWEEYRDVGNVSLPKGYYRTYLYPHFD